MKYLFIQHSRVCPQVTGMAQQLRLGGAAAAALFRLTCQAPWFCADLVATRLGGQGEDKLAQQYKSSHSRFV
jgi:hypothetical protein